MREPSKKIKDAPVQLCRILRADGEINAGSHELFCLRKSSFSFLDPLQRRFECSGRTEAQSVHITPGETQLSADSAVSCPPRYLTFLTTSTCQYLSIQYALCRSSHSDLIVAFKLLSGRRYFMASSEAVSYLFTCSVRFRSRICLISHVKS